MSWTLLKLKTFLSKLYYKGSKKKRKNPQNGKKIFVNHIYDRDLYLGI